uniref:RHS repeat domain-containing protein n=1 Tax=Massilia sp. S19_KUP03_FR1 TaxID=3025503 RepID=UPI002FCD6F47
QATRRGSLKLAPTTDVKALMAGNDGKYDIALDPLWNGESQQEAEPFGKQEIAFYQCDHLGTPQELTDHEGKVAWSAQYKAWGEAKEAISEAARKAEMRNPIRFQGQYFDDETGLHYNRYRYYDPQCGCYLSHDPIGLSGGAHTRRYVQNNPARGVDPLGLVDINMFPSHEAIREYAENIPSPPGTFTVGGHGNSQSILTSENKPLSARELALRIRNHPKYECGMPVQLFSCETGQGTDPIAKKLAKELKSPVKAPDKILWIYSNGETVPMGMKRNLDGEDIMDTSQPGKWKKFKFRKFFFF